MGSLGRDLRHAARAAGRMPVLAAVIVVSLAVGIGVNATVFSWLRAVVFNPLPGVTAGRAFHFVEAVTETGAPTGSRSGT